MQTILENGAKISPLFTIPWVTKDLCRIDWLHCADQGVTADWLGNLFIMFVSKMEGGSHATRVNALWDRVQQFYTEKSVGDRLHNLLPTMLKQPKKSPKLRGSAAQVRALVPFALKCAEDLLAGGSPAEIAALVGTRHLSECYKALSHESIFFADVLRENSIAFALQYCALEQFFEHPKAWRVKPKLHLFLEICSEGSKPALFWTYRDEDFGGSVSRLARRRGGLLSVRAFSNNLLQCFRMQQPMVRMVE